MIITAIKRVRTRDVSVYAWANLLKFQNISYVSSLICNLHSVTDKKQIENTRKIAEQIKFCLSQAREYFDAAKAVSLATKPVLLYYSLMSLVLAEIMLKRGGDYRLSKLREKHGSHGLKFALSGSLSNKDSASILMSSLTARQELDSIDCPRGTFEVWRQGARETPIGAFIENSLLNGTKNTGYGAVLFPADDAPRMLPSEGISLLECFQNLPYLDQCLQESGQNIDMIRASVSVLRSENQPLEQLTICIHPNHQELLDKFGELIRLAPSKVQELEIKEAPSGYVLNLMLDRLDPIIKGFPYGICLTDRDVYFSCSDSMLGEYGYLYVAFHICGNFARYHPDLWLKHIEDSTGLAAAIEQLCSSALERVPLLALSEMTRIYHVVEH